LAKNRCVSDPAADSKTAYELTFAQRVIVATVGRLIRLWGRSLRVEITAEDRQTLGRQDQPVAIVAWHNRLFMATEIYRRFRGGRPYWGLVSASKDGAWLVGIFEAVGIPAIRGSSSWGAREAASAVIQKLKAGDDVAITPDGPKGPCYEFKAGGLIVTRRANAPMLLLGMDYTRYWQLKSWDRLIIPLPFSRMRIRCRNVDPESLPKNRDEALAELTAIMREINGPDL
jgi:lysophospholipid acyltransferase (LPLAT)-like uncharacterized protein